MLVLAAFLCVLAAVMAPRGASQPHDQTSASAANDPSTGYHGTFEDDPTTVPPSAASREQELVAALEDMGKDAQAKDGDLPTPAADAPPQDDPMKAMLEEAEQDAKKKP